MTSSEIREKSMAASIFCTSGRLPRALLGSPAPRCRRVPNLPPSGGEAKAITRDVQIGRSWEHNPFLRRLVVTYLAIWLIAAIAPHDRGDWLLENLVVFAAVALLAATHRRFAFSNLSSLLIALFLAMHAVGAHYTYSLAPPGFWLRDALGLDRNPYDRVAHFAFGALLTYPIRELVLRRLHVHGVWSYGLPLLAVLSLSAGYEIVESWAARIVDPALGTAFLGTQGDEWDAQKDMSLAVGGSALCLAATAVWRRRTRSEPWQLLSPHASDREPDASAGGASKPTG